MINYEVRAQEALDRMKRQLAAVSWDEVNQSKTIKKAWREEMSTVRKTVQQDARKAVPNDRAGAWKGVKALTYKRLTGGNVSILQSKGTTMNMTIYNREHKRYTSERTRQVESYWGTSRSFILRFAAVGTGVRVAGSRGNSKGGSGNRGSLTASRWFSSSAVPAMERSVERIKDVYTTVMNQEFYKK